MKNALHFRFNFENIAPPKMKIAHHNEPKQKNQEGKVSWCHLLVR